MRITGFFVILGLMALFFGSGGAVSASYSGQLDVSVNRSTVSAGDAIEVSVEVGNRGAVPIANGYVVLDIQLGCAEATYPSQLADCDTVFWEDQVRNINLPRGGSEQRSITYTVPEDVRSGTYRVDAYFKTNRTRISGIPFIYLNPVSASFEVTDGGSFPALHINRTRTRFRGHVIPAGSWNPGTADFEDTEWPWIAGPVGVFVNQSTATVPGRVVVENLDDEASSGAVDFLVCEWDDTACEAVIDEQEASFEIPAAGTERVRIDLDAPDSPGAYAIRIEVSEEGRLSSVYRNRIIVAGKTARVRKLAVNRPYIPAGESLAVHAVAGAPPDHYTNPSVEDSRVRVSVEDLKTGRTIIDGTKSIRRLSRFNALEGRWFNTTVNSTVSRFNVSATLASEDGDVYDSYHYVVEASDFAGPVRTVELDDVVVDEQGLTVSLCGESASGIPTSGEVQSVLRSEGDIIGRDNVALSPCGDVVYPGRSEASGTLVVNAVEQVRFDLSEYDSSTGEDESDTNEVNQEKTSGQSQDEEKVPWSTVAVVALVVILAGLVYRRMVQGDGVEVAER